MVDKVFPLPLQNSLQGQTITAQWESIPVGFCHGGRVSAQEVGRSTLGKGFGRNQQCKTVRMRACGGGMLEAGRQRGEVWS